MNKEIFLRELSYLLPDMEEDEREAQILEHLGSPEKVAAEIRWGLREDDGSGEFTERGYRDERFAEDNRVPDKYAQPVRSSQSGSGQREEGKGEAEETGGRSEASSGREIRRRTRGNGRNGLLLLLLLIFFGFPLMGTIISAGFSVVLGILGGVVGIFGGLFGLIAAGIAGIVGLLLGGVSLIGGGVGMIVSLFSLPTGLMAVCFGFMLIALGLLLIIAVKWGCSVAVPGFCRFCVNTAGQFCRWIVGILRGMLDRIFRRGGASR